MSNVTAAEIVGCVARAFGVSRSKMLEYRRHGRPDLEISNARSAVVLLVAKHTLTSRKDLAEVFGRQCNDDWRSYMRAAMSAAIDRSINDAAYMRKLAAAERMIDDIHERRAEYPITDMTDAWGTEGLVA